MKKSVIVDCLKLALYLALTATLIALSIIFKGGIRVVSIILAVAAAFMAFAYATVIIYDSVMRKKEKETLKKEAEKEMLYHSEKEQIYAEISSIHEAIKNGAENKEELTERRYRLQRELRKLQDNWYEEIKRDDSAMCYSMSMTPPSGGNGSRPDAFSLIDRFDEHKYDDLIAEINAAHDEKTDNSTDA